MKHIWTSSGNRSYHRSSERRSVTLPARLTWKDQRGATRFATVLTRNVSEHGVYVECASAVSIPLFRLVQFQLEREVHESDALPDALRQGRILSAVYRVSPAKPSSGAPLGLALRLMVEPRHRAAARSGEESRATA
jgi:hypothetical protein